MTHQPGNADRRQQLREARIERLLLEEELRVGRLRQAKRHVELRESAESWEWLDGWSDVLDRWRGGADGLFNPISTAADRRYGANWPFYRSWWEHARLRAAARILWQMGNQARGVLDGIGGYVVGEGFTFTAKARSSAGAVPLQLLAAVNEAIGEFSAANEWGGLQHELFVRDRRDGDAFLRHFAQDDGMLLVRVLDAPTIIEPSGCDPATSSFGIENDPEDTETVLGVWWDPDGNAGSADFIDVSELTLFKANVDRGIKRGLSDFSFDCYDTFKSCARLLENMGEGAAIQAAIALVRQHEGSSGGAVSEFVGGAADRMAPDPFRGQDTPSTRYSPGRIEDIPKGMNYVAPPFMANAQAGVTILQALLRAAGVRWNAPEWLMSGDASNNNYASSLTAEAPFTRSCKRAQGYYGPRFLSVVRAAVKARCDAGRLRACGRPWSYRELCRLVEITAEPPKLQVRDPLEQANESKVLIETGISSRQIECAKSGNDWHQVERDNEEWDKKQAAKRPPQMPGQPPQNGPPGQPPPGKPPAPPAPMTEGLTESVEADDDGEPVDVEALADLFYGLYGEKALAHLKELAGGLTESWDGRCAVLLRRLNVGLLEAWDAAVHPRGPGGKFIAKGSGEAVAAATSAVEKVFKGEKADPQEVLNHLSVLTVKQVQALAKKYGKTAPKLLRAELIDAVRQIVEGNTAGKGEEASTEQPRTGHGLEHGSADDRALMLKTVLDDAASRPDDGTSPVDVSAAQKLRTLFRPPRGVAPTLDDWLEQYHKLGTKNYARPEDHALVNDAFAEALAKFPDADVERAARAGLVSSYEPPPGKAKGGTYPAFLDSAIPGYARFLRERLGARPAGGEAAEVSKAPEQNTQKSVDSLRTDAYTAGGEGKPPEGKAMTLRPTDPPKIDMHRTNQHFAQLAKDNGGKLPSITGDQATAAFKAGKEAVAAHLASHPKDAVRADDLADRFMNAMALIRNAAEAAAGSLGAANSWHYGEEYHHLRGMYEAWEKAADGGAA